MIIFSVDDASLARLVIKKATLELGYQFDEAPDGEAAIRKLLSIKEEVSAIFLDWHMPKMNGITFLEEVKKYPTLKDIPIVMATSDSKQKNVFRALKAGAANYIFKPYSSDAIMIKIVETVKKIEPKKQTTKINPDSKDEDLIKAMMEATPIGIIIFDKKDRTILNINQYALKNFFDTTKDKCLGQNIDEKILLISKPRTPEVDHSVCNNEKRRLISLHGPIDVVTTIVPIIYQGKECYFETLNDISAITNEHARLEIANQKLKKSHNQLEKSLEEVKLAHKIKSEFLANMSHELRTPLNGIIGFTGILLEDQLQDDQRESLDTIKLCSDNLLTLINDVLDITKIESNKLTLENIPFNIEDILYDANDMIRAKVEDKSLELLVDTRNTFALVMGDPTRLKQVFTNLLGNAIKFTNSGEIVSTIEMIHENETDVILKMSIKDTGIGIPKDSQQYIFESFRQADGSTTRRYGGTGLGLAISKSIVEAMGGELQLNSIENVGTEFYFQINFQKALLPIKSQSFSDFSSLRKASILYIDDNQLSLDIVASHCKKVGLQLTTTQNASEALHLIKEKDFDIILLDTRIPEYNGFNLLKDIRSLVNCPITALTTDIRPSTISKIKSSAFNGYLIKPVRAESLLKVLAKLIAELPDEKVTLNETLVTADSLICLDILIAEDNLVNQKLIHRLLTNMGHNPTLADDGSIAYEAATKDRFDLIFMDMKMPNMSGTEATKLIVKAGIKTPIIAMTANASKEDQQECLDAGMVNFITKPLKRDVLRDILFKYSHLNQKIKIPKQARLLIADDNPLVLSALSHFCHRAFPLVTIKLAKDGIEACAYLGSFLPHVIITDIMMPNMNGLDLIRFIKKDQRYQHTKVIALSAMSKNDPIIKDILDLDVFAYLNKPYEGEILKSKMQAALDSSFQDT